MTNDHPTSGASALVAIDIAKHRNEVLNEAPAQRWRSGSGRKFAIYVDESTVGRELFRLGFAKLSVRPRHYAQDPEALEAFKKTPPGL